MAVEASWTEPPFNASYLDHFSLDTPSASMSSYDWQTCLGCLQFQCICAPDHIESQLEQDFPDDSCGVPRVQSQPTKPERNSKSERKPLRRARIVENRDSASKRRERRSKAAARSPSPKFRRTTITDKNKKALEDYFDLCPYPDKDTFCRLAQVTQLPTRAIKTWFANARSRKALPHGEYSFLQLHSLACLRKLLTSGKGT
jgi:hypothetical protein